MSDIAAGACSQQQQLVVPGGGFMNSDQAAASGRMSCSNIGVLCSTDDDDDDDVTILQSFDQQFNAALIPTSTSSDHRSCSTYSTDGDFYGAAADHGRPDFMISSSSCKSLISSDDDDHHHSLSFLRVASDSLLDQQFISPGATTRENRISLMGFKFEQSLVENDELHSTDVGSKKADPTGEEAAVDMSASSIDLAEIILPEPLKLQASIRADPGIPSLLHDSGIEQVHNTPALPSEQLQNICGNQQHSTHRHLPSGPAICTSSSDMKNRMQSRPYEIVLAASSNQPLLRRRRGLSLLDDIHPLLPKLPALSVIRPASSEISQQRLDAVSPFSTNTRRGHCSKPAARTKNETNSTSDLPPDQQYKPTAGLECNIDPLISPCSVLTSPGLISKLDYRDCKSTYCRGAVQLHEGLPPSPTAAERPHKGIDDNKRLQTADHIPVMSTADGRSPVASGAALSLARRKSPDTSDAAEAGGQGDVSMRPRRKRMRPSLNCMNIIGIDAEVAQSQRMTHIAVERNRRKQMNENLCALRALMPGSYVPKGDQASIIGSAIEFVKELEQLLKCLQAQKKRRSYASELKNVMSPAARSPMSPKGALALTLHPRAASSATAAAFQDLSAATPAAGTTTTTTSPTSTSCSMISTTAAAASRSDVNNNYMTASPSCMKLYVNAENFLEPAGVTSDQAGFIAQTKSEMGNVEVKTVGSNAWIKVLSQRRSAGQLLRTMTTLESLDFTIIHSNITTVDNTALYSFHVWIGNKCVSTVEEIAAAIQHTLRHN